MRLSLSSLSRSAELSPLSPPSPGPVPCVQLFGSVSGSVSKACAPKSLALLEHSLHEEEVNPVPQTTADVCCDTREVRARAAPGGSRRRWTRIQCRYHSRIYIYGAMYIDFE